MVAIRKEPAPRDHESSLKNQIWNLSLARCPCANSEDEIQMLAFLFFFLHTRNNFLHYILESFWSLSMTFNMNLPLFMTFTMTLNMTLTMTMALRRLFLGLGQNWWSQLWINLFVSWLIKSINISIQTFKRDKSCP